MTEEEKQFIESFLYGDGSKYDDVGRLQVEEWYKAFGQKVLRDVDLKEVPKKLEEVIEKRNRDDANVNINITKYWEYWEYWHGDPIFKRKAVVEDLLEMRGDDGKYLLDDYDRYQLACWSYSESLEKISLRFENISLEEYRKMRPDSHIDFAKRLDRYSKLMGFWYRYNILYGSKGHEFHENDEDPIKKNLKELLSDYHIVVDSAELWRYGFECAKEEGCVEALEFFLERLEEKKISKEKINTLLIDTALYAADSTVLGLGHSNAHVIVFCLTHLYDNQEINYKNLLKKDYDAHKYHAVLDRLKEKYLFGHVEVLMGCLDNLTPENYSTHFIYAVGLQAGDAPNKELRDTASEFLKLVWENDKFETHRNHCLNELHQGNSELIRMLLRLAQVGALSPLKQIWDAAKDKDNNKHKEIADSFYDSLETGCALYIQGQGCRDLLGDILSNPKGSACATAFLTKVMATLSELGIIKYDQQDIKDDMLKISEKCYELEKNYTPDISQSDDPAFSSPEAPLSSTPQRVNQELLPSTTQSRGQDLLSSTRQSRGHDLLSSTPRSSEQKELLSKKTGKKLF